MKGGSCHVLERKKNTYHNGITQGGNEMKKKIENEKKNSQKDVLLP
jgi:hypothetical protein